MVQEKIDLRKTIAGYKAGKAPALADIPKMKCIQIEGSGDPNTSKEFAQAIEALYAVAYGIKFMVRNGDSGVDYGVLPLEGLWWADDMNDFLKGAKDKWHWRAMIMQPDFVTKELYDAAVKQAAAKKDLPALPFMQFTTFHEGKCAQVLYTGPYSNEHDTILALHDFIGKNGYKLHGYHHEIYLNDARRTAPEKLKTIIRQPVKK